MRVKLKIIALLLVFLIALPSVGVYASWQYATEDYNFINRLAMHLTASLSPWSDFPEEQTTVSEKMKSILNSETEQEIEINGVTYTDTFDALIAAFENSASNNSSISFHNDSYIGSMQTTGDDVAALLALFGDSLKNEQGRNEYYDIMLKRENLDGDNTTGMGYYMNGDHNWSEENKYYMGNEIVLFSTDQDIPNYNQWRPQKVRVYATVYSRKPRVDLSGKAIQKTYTDETGTYLVYHYVVNAGYESGYEIEVYKKDGLYYSVSDGTLIAGRGAAVYEIYDYTGCTWKEIGYYTGEAMVVNYSTGSSTPSFDTGQWRNTEDYGHGTGLTLANCVYYTLNP